MTENKNDHSEEHEETHQEEEDKPNYLAIGIALGPASKRNKYLIFANPTKGI